MLALSVQAEPFTIASGETEIISSSKILNDGETGTIEEAGTLQGSGEHAAIVWGVGPNVRILNNGMVASSGNNSPAVDAGASGAEITNNGLLATSGVSSHGILVKGASDKATIINNGAIMTQEFQSHGIQASGKNTEITHSDSGTITTKGKRSHGIWASGKNTKITHSGTITTGGETAFGIWLSKNAEIIHSDSGTITTQGKNGYGIVATGENAEITYSGTITTQGENGYGIQATGKNTKITHSGTITTQGKNGYGIRATGEKVEITHSGMITTEGETAHGILTGADSTVTVSGLVSVTGRDAYAILGSDTNSQTLNILPGARIVGRINLGEKDGGGDNDVVNVMTDTRMTSAAWTFEGAETINLATSDMPVLRNGDTVVMLDSTGSAAARMALGATTSQIHGAVHRQLAQAPGLTKSGANAWGRFFGGDSKRGDDGAALAWRHNLIGLVVGHEAILAGGHRVGVLVGVSHGQAETKTTLISTDADGVFAGAYGQRIIINERGVGGLALNGAVIIGHQDHDGKRTVLDNLAGYETADGDYGSIYISPSLSLTWTRPLAGGLELRPHAQVAYTHGHYDGYTESGTANSNLRFGGRNVDVASGRLQLGLARALAGDKGEVEWRVGAEHMDYGKDSATVQLDGGDAVSYKVPGANRVTGGYLGVRMDYAIKDRFNLVADVEYGRASGSEESLAGTLGLEIKL